MKSLTIILKKNSKHCIPKGDKYSGLGILKYVTVTIDNDMYMISHVNTRSVDNEVDISLMKLATPLLVSVCHANGLSELKEKIINEVNSKCDIIEKIIEK